MIGHPYNLPSSRPDTGSLSSGAGFRVRYLGSTTCSSKGRLKNGISGFQKPLLDLYVAARRRGEDYRSVHPLALTQHIDLCDYGVVVAETEEDMESGDEVPIVTKVITPLSNIVLWAAVRFHTRIIKKKVFGAAFVPIACSDGVLDKNSFNQLTPRQRFLVSLTHPPIFTCVLQRVASPKTLECHSFVCASAEDALTLCSMLGDLRERSNQVGSLGLVPDDFIGYSYSRHFTRNGSSNVESSVISPSEVSSRYASSYPSDDTQTTQKVESYEENSTRGSPYVSGRRQRGGTPRENFRQGGFPGHRHQGSSFKETSKKSRYVEDSKRKSNANGESRTLHTLAVPKRNPSYHRRDVDSSSDLGRKYDQKSNKRHNQPSPSSSKERFMSDHLGDANKACKSRSSFRDAKNSPSPHTPKPTPAHRERMTISHTMDFSSESELESALSPSERRLALRLPELRSKQQTIPEEPEWTGNNSTIKSGTNNLNRGTTMDHQRSENRLSNKYRCGSVASLESSPQWILTREMGTMTEDGPLRISDEVSNRDIECLDANFRRHSISSSVDQLYAKPRRKSQRPCHETTELSETMDLSSESKSSSIVTVDSRHASRSSRNNHNRDDYRYVDHSYGDKVQDHSLESLDDDNETRRYCKSSVYRRAQSALDIPTDCHREIINVPYHAATIDRTVRGRREDRNLSNGEAACIRITVPYSKQRGTSDTSSYLGTGAQHIPQGIRSFHKRGNVRNWSTLSQTSEMSFEGSATLPMARTTRQNHKAIRWSSAERLSTRPSFLRSIKRLSVKSFAQARKTTGKLFSTLRTKIKDRKANKKGSEISEDSAYDTSEVCLRPDGNPPPPPSKPLRKAQRQMSWSFHDLRDSFPGRVKKKNHSKSESKEEVYVVNEDHHIASKTKHKTKKKTKKRRRRRPSSNSMSSDSGVEEYQSDYSLPSHYKSESELEKFASEVTLINVKHGLTERKFRRFSHTNLQNELGYIP